MLYRQIFSSILPFIVVLWRLNQWFLKNACSKALKKQAF